MSTAPPISAPEDPPVREALRLRHGDEVLLERLDHVTAQKAHVDGDLCDGEAQRG
jgi:hypothetical protein